ncbi:FecCD family ABC transporter permease [Lactococcus paracarnosus]|uniref:ABC transporter n=1 Tax=Pseudolactococcus paracarnosus TaxID=2749962 RepID=A0A7L4WCN6_9LACT|nr:iron ABC transporter permease [Lactococcus paracarnosus]SPC36114.1 Vitamin B12 ABC transporter, permease component BtuC [Lactococcus piscium]MCJ1976982.1 iron ABC transporter permease [Lactococcus paracarnosus]MCJ1983393.1 iron ABC transporter permease [Lactococcus paracarnosus]MCJ1993668.1 iron ABC transporter permease [Lactococcus paracarnosus]MCJ1998769.1 iron ABC transporter permease [Lactococcus paracarnosus]
MFGITNRRNIPIAIWIIIFLIIISLSIIVSVSHGQADISFWDVVQILVNKISHGAIGDIKDLPVSSVNIIWFIRMPRICLAIFVGLGLALCGMVMQAVVQNPLADPYILGISSGSSLGATFAILIGFGSSSIFSQFGVGFGAFVGAMIATFSVLLLSSIGGRMTSVKLVLSGSVISSLLGAISNLVVYLAGNSEGIKTIQFWLMGSLASASWSKLGMVILPVLAVFIFFTTQSRVLNVMLLGDEAAITLGVSLVNYRRLYMSLTALVTGLIVANSGMIGFVGLIIPHIVRALFGSDHKVTLPMTAVSGALFMIWADLISRVLIKSVELPIGIITAMIGAPLFIYIIVKKGYSFGS